MVVYAVNDEPVISVLKRRPDGTVRELPEDGRLSIDGLDLAKLVSFSGFRQNTGFELFRSEGARPSRDSGDFGAQEQWRLKLVKRYK